MQGKSKHVCRDYVRGFCTRANCRYSHEIPSNKADLKGLFQFCHDFQNKGCFRFNCKFIHSSIEDEENFYTTGTFPSDPRNITDYQNFIPADCSSVEGQYGHQTDFENFDVAHKPKMSVSPFNRPPPYLNSDTDDSPPKAKLKRYTIHDGVIEEQPSMNGTMICNNCENSEHTIQLLHDNISVLLKKVSDLTQKNVQLTSMNEFLLGQTGSFREISRDHPCVITSRHGTSAPVSLATVSVTPVVSLAGALPTLVPAGATPSLTLAPDSSRTQLLTPAPQLITVSTTQQLVGNSGTLIVTSAGAHQLMQASTARALMGGGQTVVAVAAPAQIAIAPSAQQLMGNAPQATVQQLVQQSAQGLVQQQAPTLVQQQAPTLVQQQFTPQQQLAQQSAQQLAAAQQSAQQLAAAQQTVQLAAAQQSAQLAAAQQSAQQLAAAAQQSAQQLAAAQQSAQQLAAAQQSAQQQLVRSTQQLVHQSNSQHMSNTSRPIQLPNSVQTITYPIISQSILPH